MKKIWESLIKSYYQSVFGDLTKLKGSDKDIEALVSNILSEHKELPRIYLAIGTEDFYLSLIVNSINS